jgi:hypothetical protein
MNIDPVAATAAYIDGLGAEALARAAAYTSGNQVLLFAGLLVTAATAWLVVRSGWSGSMPAWAAVAATCGRSRSPQRSS